MPSMKGLKKLVGLDTSPYPTVSLYLDVDGRKFPNREFEVSLKNLIRNAQTEIERLDTNTQDSVRSDLAKVEDYVHRQFTRDHTRMLVLFACGPKDLFETFQSDHSIKSRLVIHKNPYTTPLLTLQSEMPDALVIMTDRTTARFFTFQAGRLEELDHWKGDVPANVRMSGWKGYEERQIERHIGEHVQWHLKLVADQSRRWDKFYNPDVILLAGPVEIVRDLRRWLPPRLQSKTGSDLTLHYESGHQNAIRNAVQEALIRDEYTRQAALIDQIDDQQPHHAATGTERTLDALNTFRVSVLVFDPDLQIRGRRCSQCAYIATNMDNCPRCHIPMSPNEDLLAEAIELAITQSANVVPVRDRPELVGKIGRIGALLRY